LNQEVFRGTVVENITCGLEGVDMVQVVEATQKTGIDGYIQSLPQGYYTILEPQGAGLPGSVSRKIVEARYLIKRPRLLLIEDNTPFVNPEEREAFFQLVFHHFKHTTMVIVTNDAKLKSQCDAVYSIDHGTLIKNNA
jgi:ABC-type multidrug transport system fused ATPase/permease subunit